MQGHDAGTLRIRTLMRKMGISALAPQLGISCRNPQHKVFTYLLRKMAIKRSNQVWALDTTYIRMARGFVYLMAVVDVKSRRILALDQVRTCLSWSLRQRERLAHGHRAIHQLVQQ